MTNRTPVDRLRTLRLLGALVGLSIVLGACNADRGNRDGERSQRLPPASSDRRDRKPTARSSCSSAMRAAACPRRSAPTSWDWRRPGFAKAPARSSPTCRSTRRTRAPRRPRTGKSGRCWRRAACPRAPSRCVTTVRTIRARLPTIRLSYPEDCGGRRPLRPVAGGSRAQLDHDTGYNENKPYHNFGCATQRNLAAMIDNPADLEQPRPETPAYTDAARRRRSRNIARASRPRPPIPKPTRPNSAIQANDQPRPSKLRRTLRRHAAARRRLYLAGAARLGAGLLRDASRPPPRCARRAKTAASARPISRSTWAASPPPSKPITRRLRRT